ncbi:MAG: hypothetical protein KGI57_05995, partial [Hyphomicrobiales bacterium]|nr:hypothetical protein [Hyphomicrobiales bacterium]
MDRDSIAFQFSKYNLKLSDGRPMTTKPTVIVAGIGGASLGTEVLKCLRHSGAWNVVGCDVSPFAFGHYAGLASATAVVNADDYASSVLALAKRAGAIAVVPGAGAPLKLLNESRNDFSNAGVIVVGNSARTVALADDKSAVAAAFDA